MKTTTLQPADAAAIIVRYWIAVVAVGVVGAVAAVLFVHSEQSSYTGTAKVLVSPMTQVQQLPSVGSQPNPTQLPDPDRYVRDQILVASGRPVLQQAAATAHVSESGLAARTTVGQDQVTDVIDVGVDAGSATSAARQANAVANAFIAVTRQRAAQRYAAQASAVGASIASVQQRLSIARTNPIVAHALKQELATLVQDQQTLTATGAIQGGDVSRLSGATAHLATSTKASTARTAVLGAVAGGLMMIVLLLAWAFFGGRVQSVDDALVRLDSSAAWLVPTGRRGRALVGPSYPLVAAAVDAAAAQHGHEDSRVGVIGTETTDAAHVANHVNAALAELGTNLSGDAGASAHAVSITDPPARGIRMIKDFSGLLVVVRLGATRRNELEQIASLAKSYEVPVLGVVVLASRAQSNRRPVVAA